MKFYLNSINCKRIFETMSEYLISEHPQIIQYADFNVLNHLYKENYCVYDMKKVFLYPDSTALYIFIRLFVNHKFKKIISTNLQNDLLVELNNNSFSVFLFGDSDFVLNKTIHNLKQKFSQIEIKGFNNGYNFNSEEVIEKINKYNVDVVFVGLGIERQEKWLIEHSDKINARLILSVGGWFQYLAENKKRAPLIIRKVHLEWLHKLIVEFPRVWKRYLIGLPLFYFRLVTRKIIIHLDD